MLILIDSLGLGGAESLLLPFIRAAPNAALHVEVVSVAGRDDERRQMVPLLEELGIRPHFLDSHRLLTPGAVPRLVHIMNETGCDIAHAHLENAITLAAVAGRLVGRPTVCTFHHNPYDMPWRDTARERLAVLASSCCARTIFVSAASMAGWERRYGRRTNWTVVRNGVDLGQFETPPVPSPLPEELGIPPQVPVALLAASMREKKGHETAIAAWPDVLARVPDARLLLVGSGEKEAFLRSEVAAHDLGASVVFAGFRSDMPRLVQGSTLVLLPSESEALPTVLLEAGAAGR
ncbi:MAG: glycosyltransferase, partial [Actinomycetota bacterium]|nr:glycosyltransferase [Actinomycetota bacterium]